jgi:hypothetical protein
MFSSPTSISSGNLVSYTCNIRRHEGAGDTECQYYPDGVSRSPNADGVHGKLLMTDTEVIHEYRQRMSKYPLLRSEQHETISQAKCIL